MWIRLGIMAVLSLRSMRIHASASCQTRLEWRIGLLYYLFFLPVGAVLAYLLRFARFHPPALDWWKLALLVPGTFLAFCGWSRYSRNSFFRAFLQRLVARALSSEVGLA